MNQLNRIYLNVPTLKRTLYALTFASDHAYPGRILRTTQSSRELSDIPAKKKQVSHESTDSETDIEIIQISVTSVALCLANMTEFSDMCVGHFVNLTDLVDR